MERVVVGEARGVRSMCRTLGCLDLYNILEMIKKRLLKLKDVILMTINTHNN